MSGEEKFCLKWNDFQNNISKAFKELKDDEDFFDVTLACEGNSLKAHKVILSACSPFFKSVLKLNKHAHPLIYLKGVKYEEMCSVIDFMYYGEVSVAQVDLTSFLLVAEELQVRGLSQSGQENTFSREAMSMTKKSFPDPTAYNVPTKPFKLPEINSSFSQAIPSEVNDSVIAVERTESIVVDVECDPLLTDEQHLEDDDQIAVPEEEDLVNHHNYQEQIRHMGHITNNGQGNETFQPLHQGRHTADQIFKFTLDFCIYLYGPRKGLSISIISRTSSQVFNSKVCMKINKEKKSMFFLNKKPR